MNCNTIPPNETGESKERAYLFEQVEILKEHNRTQALEVDRLEALVATKDVSVSDIKNAYRQKCTSAICKSIGEQPRRASQTLQSLRDVFEEQATKQETLNKTCNGQDFEIRALHEERGELRNMLLDQEKVSQELSDMIDHQASEMEEFIAMFEQQRDKIRELQEAKESLETQLRSSQHDRKKKRVSFKDQKNVISSLKKENKKLLKKMKLGEEKERPQDDTLDDECNADEKVAISLLQRLREEGSEAVKLLDLLGEDVAKKEALQLIDQKRKNRSTSIECNMETFVSKQTEDKRNIKDGAKYLSEMQLEYLQLEKEALEESLGRAKEENKKLVRLLEESKMTMGVLRDASQLVSSLGDEKKSKTDYLDRLCKEQSQLIDSLRIENALLFEKFQMKADADLKRKPDSSIPLTKYRELQKKTEMAEMDVQKLNKSINMSESKLEESQSEVTIMTAGNRKTREQLGGLHSQPGLRAKGERIEMLEEAKEVFEEKCKSQKAEVVSLKSEKDKLLEQLTVARKNIAPSVEDTADIVRDNDGISKEFTVLHDSQDSISSSTISLAPEAEVNQEAEGGKEKDHQLSSMISIFEASLLVRNVKSLATGMLRVIEDEADWAQFEEQPVQILPLLQPIDTRSFGYFDQRVGDSEKVAKHDGGIPQECALQATASEESAGSSSTKISFDGDHKLPSESQWLSESVQ